MRIESVEAFYLRLPEVRAIGDGSQDALLIRVRAGGLDGWGEAEASPLPTIAALVAPMSHSACRPVLDSVLGQPLNGPEDIRRIHATVKANSMDLLQADHALSGIDIALWDLLGKRLEEPVWALLGEDNFPKRAYASQLFGETPTETFSAATRAAAAGFTAAKFGWGPIGLGALVEDEAQFSAAREGLGADAALFIDTGCVFGHDVERARSRIASLEAVGAAWWEEPFVGGALREYAALSSATRIPLAGGEGAHNADHSMHLIDYGGVRFIQVDAGRIGGITEARKVATYARNRQVEYVNHTFTSNLALSASLQPYADHVGAYAEVPFAASELAVAIGGAAWALDGNGCVIPPSDPGLGITPSLKSLQNYITPVELLWNGFRLWPT